MARRLLAADSRQKDQLFGGDHRTVRASEWRNPKRGKTGISHPADTVGAGKVEPASGLDQHVEARQQTSQVSPARIVDQKLVDDQRPALFQRGTRLDAGTAATTA
jgi:hypothetical protein